MICIVDLPWGTFDKRFDVCPFFVVLKVVWLWSDPLQDGKNLTAGLDEKSRCDRMFFSPFAGRELEGFLF
jgi:hypothetical protein